MVQCYGCSAQLNGSWTFNYQGHNNGSYLGVDAYFAYSRPNWVYCFCANCYNNGKFGDYIKKCYPDCINKIIQDATNPLQQ
jgi:hypothetical protein